MPERSCFKTSVFFMLIVRPKRLAAQAKQSVIICASSSECATRAQSSASSQQLRDFWIWHWASKDWRFLRQLCSAHWCQDGCCERHPGAWLHRICWKRSGARTQPCLVPLRTVNGSESPATSTTLAVMPSWKDLKDLMTFTSLSGQPSFLRNAHRLSLLCFHQVNEYQVNRKKNKVLPEPYGP